MGKLNVKNGTPVGNAHLCMNCSWGQCITGYRESDRLVICNKTSPDFVVPFTVLDCSCFEDKYKPDWRQMQKLAIDIQPVRVSAKTSGFSVISTPQPTVGVGGDEDEDEDEVALSR